MDHPVLQFLGTVFWSYYTGVGGIVSLLIEAWSRLRGGKAHLHWWWVFAVLGVLLSSYQAWNQQHIALNNAQTKLGDLSKPVITGTLQQILVGQNPDGTMVEVVEVYVQNGGTPTNLTNWNLNIRNEHLNLNAINCVMPAELNVNSTIGLKGKVNRNHMLQELTIRKIERGDSRTGWLIFTFPKYDIKRVVKGTLFTITCVDVFGNVHEIKRSLVEGAIPLTADLGLRYSPGSEQLFDSPSATPSPSNRHLARRRH